MEIVQSFVTKNDCYKSGRTLNVKGLMLHSVGCGQPKAQVFVNIYNKPNYKVCVHGFIDANTGVVYQTLPWNHRAWHCGGSANNTHIGIEMCEPASIRYTGGATFICTNQETAIKSVMIAYNSAVELFAQLCQKFNLDPLKDGVIISHNEGHKRGLASGHADPEHLWRQLKLNYTMDGFRQDVANKMEEDNMTQEKFNEMMNNYIADLAKKPATWEQSALSWAQTNGLMMGNEKGEIMPKKFITRGELVTVLQRLVKMLEKQ